MNAHYQEIALILEEVCPAGYTKAWVEAEVKPDWNRQIIWCEIGNNKSQPDMDVLKQYSIGQNLTALQLEMTIPGEEPWSRCTFTLFPDGKFKFDVEYDD